MSSHTQTMPNAPTVTEVQKYVREWNEDKRYTDKEAAVSLLCQQFPRNDEIARVLLKVSAINDFYSTNIYDVYPVAKRIVEIDVSERIASGDLSVVKEVSEVVVSGKQWHFYSFASKYCSFHNLKVFPMYDSFVEEALMHFLSSDGFAQFQRKELKEYASFVKIVHDFMKAYRLEQFSLREIDFYLWRVGKDLVPPKKPRRRKNRISN